MDGLTDQRNITLEFRKVTSLHWELFDIGLGFIGDDRSRITIKQEWFWQRLWPHIDKVTLTVRLLDAGHHGTPISNWSPALLLANDARAYGVALPTPTPTPLPTPTYTPTPTKLPTPTHTSTPTTLPTPTYTSSPVPTTEVSLTPAASATPVSPTPSGGGFTAVWIALARHC